ncbi:PREDICTED: blue copper protein-like [Nelumbo nucifera]|uniref:Blue copper protein-like n=2 Tax=Nelumbo nucifera TaxID=4432 RepID=A0A1U8AGQ6_NELNU|nr:PREDICTED: blue copper protein-like [Nelumbo nucifera]DAD41025.1 TPA_asm: hypothetical protein HUJ06_015348 [Nelumbo nucifera]
MATTAAGIFSVVVALCCVVPSLGTVYTVGDETGWTTNVDYSSWTKGKTFAVGDSLVFNYAGGGHTVDEVSQSDYTSCTVGNAISSDSSGKSTYTLKTTGTHYFICGVLGHCGNGMKLAVTVGDGATPTPSTSTTTPTSPSTTTTTTTTPTTTSTTTSASSSTFLSPSIAILLTWLGLLKLLLS